MDIERAKLIPVAGNPDRPDTANALDVQFNPTSLKVSLSNTLQENQRNGNSRASQYVDKSSSSLTIELIYDTTYVPQQASPSGDTAAQSGQTNQSSQQDPLTEGSDVRLQTKKIAEKFVKPIGSGRRMRAPKRCLFQWGAFEFLGLVESFEETLDFFSKEGTPLRATVSLKLKQDRYQFRNNAATATQQNTPTLSSTGSTSNNNNSGDDGNGAPRPGQNTSPVQGASNDQPGNWRETAMYNGIENPRMPSASMIALPNISASASVGISANVKISATPAFNFGSSARLGTKIEGAFSTSISSNSGVSASAIINANTTSDVDIKVDIGVGFD